MKRATIINHMLEAEGCLRSGDSVGLVTFWPLQ
jgi:hypothetical protein